MRLTAWKIVPADASEPTVLTDFDIAAIQMAVIGAYTDVTVICNMNGYRQIIEKLKPVAHVAFDRLAKAEGGFGGLGPGRGSNEPPVCDQRTPDNLGVDHP